MPAQDALQQRQFGDRRQRSVSPDDVMAESRQIGRERRALLEKPGELVRPPVRPRL